MNKKWIAIIGSPRKGKNTDALVDYIIEGLGERDISVDKYYLNSRDISTCTGCECCMKLGKCIINNDVTEIIDEMYKADGYIIASPSYNYNVTAQMKAFMDRTFCLNDYISGWKSRLSPGKKAIVAGVCRGKTKEAMGFTTECMRRLLEELGVGVIDTIECFNTKENPVYSNSEAQEAVIKAVINNKVLISEQ